MDLYTSLLHTLSSGAASYFTAHQMRYSLTRPNLLASFQLAESGSVPFLQKLSERATKEGDLWLKEKLSRHAADEDRHGKIFSHSLKQIGKQAINPTKLEKNSQTTKSDQKKSDSFFETYFTGYSASDLKAENIDWIVFFGSTYILELDASKDFLRMASVLKAEDKIEGNLKKGIESIAADETRHAAYLWEAMQRSLSTSAVNEVIDEWRTRKVNAVIAMLSNFLEGSENRRSLVEDYVSEQQSSLVTA